MIQINQTIAILVDGSSKREGVQEEQELKETCQSSTSKVRGVGTILDNLLSAIISHRQCITLEYS